MKETVIKEATVKRLLLWYDNHARVLPWRENKTPYRVWISEIMLQQTRVEAVKPYFERFMNILPRMTDLAEIDEEALLKLWEGLGYYNRARNLQKTAKIVVESFGGELPADYQELLKLPGIGHYTAGAVSSIAYGLRYPAVDGNVLRVISRIALNKGDIMSNSVRTDIEKQLYEIIPEDRPGDFNQALMELGATVCVPGGPPKCSECPVQPVCEANRLKMTDVVPYKSSGKAKKIENKTVFIIRDGDKFALKKRPLKGLLAGLYEFPNVEGHLNTKEALLYMNNLGFCSIKIEPIEAAKHIFTHKEWHMKGYAVKIDEPEEYTKDKFVFVMPEETKERYAIPSAFEAYVKYLKIKRGIKR